MSTRASPPETRPLLFLEGRLFETGKEIIHLRQQFLEAGGIPRVLHPLPDHLPKIGDFPAQGHFQVPDDGQVPEGIPGREPQGVFDLLQGLFQGFHDLMSLVDSAMPSCRFPTSPIPEKQSRCMRNFPIWLSKFLSFLKARVVPGVPIHALATQDRIDLFVVFGYGATVFHRMVFIHPFYHLFPHNRSAHGGEYFIQGLRGRH